MLNKSLDNFILQLQSIIIESNDPNTLMHNSFEFLYLGLDCKSLALYNPIDKREPIYTLPKQQKYDQKELYVESIFSINEHTLILKTNQHLDQILNTQIQKLLDLFAKEISKLLINQTKEYSTRHTIFALLNRRLLGLSQKINNSTTDLEIKQKYNQLNNDQFKENIKTIFTNNDESVRNIGIFDSLMNNENRISTFTSIYFIEKIKLIMQDFLDKNNIELVCELDNVTISTYENELLEAVFYLLHSSSKSIINKKPKHREIFLKWSYKNSDSIITIECYTQEEKEENISKFFDPYYIQNLTNKNQNLGLYLSKNAICKQINGTIDVSKLTIDHNNNDSNGTKYTIILKDSNENY